MVTEDQKEALRQLLRVAEAMIPEKIDMAHWGERRHLDCGTTACLMGHAAMDPWFMDEGWSLRWDAGSVRGYLHFENGQTGPEERILFFGLDEIESNGSLDVAVGWDDYLFMPNMYFKPHTGGQALKDEIIEHVRTACECAGAL